MTAEAMRDRVARIIIGPRLPVPATSKFTLAELQEVRWGQATRVEQLDALTAADAILAALPLPDAPAADERTFTKAAKRMVAVQGMDWSTLDGGDIGYWESLAAEALNASLATEPAQVVEPEPSDLAPNPSDLPAAQLVSAAGEARARLLEAAEHGTRGRTHDGSNAGTAHWWVRVRYDDIIAALASGGVQPSVGEGWNNRDVLPREGSPVLVEYRAWDLRTNPPSYAVAWWFNDEWRPYPATDGTQFVDRWTYDLGALSAASDPSASKEGE